MSFLLLALALQSVLVDVPEDSIRKALAKAKPVANCVVGPDCEAKWARARRFVHENSRFTLLRDTDAEILTRFAIYANTDASYAVVLDPPADGQRTIRFRAWCGNFIACIPKADTITRLFVQAVADTNTAPNRD